MPGRRPISLAAIVATLFVSTCERASAEDARGPVAALGGPGASVMAGMLKQYDRDGDGHLDRAEREAAAADMLRRFDRNRDGRLDPGEQTAALVALGARRPDSNRSDEQSLEQRLTQRFDEDHDGQLDTSERNRAMKHLAHPARDPTMNRLRIELLRRLDADGNGRLNRQELDKLLGPEAGEPSSAPTAARPPAISPPDTPAER